jgi:arylmalonate decarboxylase
LETELSRRLFLQIAGARAVSGANPCLGLIFPRGNASVPAEAGTLYPSGVRFLAEGIGIGSSLPEEFDRLIDRVIPVAAQLSKSGAQAIVLMAPSLSFYQGAAFDRRMSAGITKSTGLPAVTASATIIQGLTTLHARRVAVATAYTDEINLRLQGYLNEAGFEVVILRGMGIERFEERSPITDVATPAQTMDFIARVREDRPEADTLVIAFGPLATHEMILPLEKRCRVPVVSATPHALQSGMRLLGIDARVPGFGMLLERG